MYASPLSSERPAAGVLVGELTSDLPLGGFLDHVVDADLYPGNAALDSALLRIVLLLLYSVLAAAGFTSNLLVCCVVARQSARKTTAGKSKFFFSDFWFPNYISTLTCPLSDARVGTLRSALRCLLR